MASTYSQLGIEKPADGEQSGTWGQTVNTNSEIIEQAIGGYAAVTTSAGGTVSVSITDGALSDGRAHFLKLTGSPAGSYTLELPEVEKAWTIWNASGQTATIQTASATATVSLANGGIVEVVSDGAGTVEACTKPLATDGTLLSNLPIAEGGTGSSTASAARTALGLGSVTIHQVVEDKSAVTRTMGTTLTRISEATVTVTPTNANTKLLVIAMASLFIENAGDTNAFVKAGGGYYDGTDYQSAGSTAFDFYGGAVGGASSYRSQVPFCQAYILTQSELRSDNSTWLAAVIGNEVSGDTGETRGSVIVAIEYEELS